MGGSASPVRVMPVDRSGGPSGPERERVRAELGAGVVDAAGTVRSRPPVRRLPAHRGVLAPSPAGPGRVRRPGRGGYRPVRRASAARPMAVRPARASVVSARVPAGAGRRAVAAVVLTAVASAAAVFGLGLLADAAREARVPSTVGTVQVRGEESLWQVARRAAPSADPGAVAARIVELNDLGSPSVQAGQVLLSPIG
jgi:hypothetical protein